MHRDASATNHYNTTPSNKPFTPSSWLLEQQIEAAMVKFDAARERDVHECNVKAWDAQVKATHYARWFR